MKRIVITGPTGTIGLALINKCIKEQVQVLAICRPGSENMKYIPKSDLIQIVECDLSNLCQLEVNGAYNTFYHFAWMGTIGGARNDADLQKVNIQYTLDAVQLAKRLGCNTFVGAGSQAEYGRCECDLCPNTPTFPETEYGLAKLKAGEQSKRLCHDLGLRHNWVRILSVYGPFDDEKTMVMSTILSLLDGETPKCTVGSQKWDFLYSDDAADALLRLGEFGVDGKTYCLGSGETRPLREYIEIINRIVNPNCAVDFGAVPFNENQIMYLCADIKELVEDVGFTPTTTFEEGIRKVLKSLLMVRGEI